MSGLLSGLAAGISGAASAAADIAGGYIKNEQALDLKRQLIVMEELRDRRATEYKQQYSDQVRQRRAGDIRQGVDAEVTKRYGAQDPDVGPVKEPSRTDLLRLRHDVAADLGYDESAAGTLKATDAETRADYYGGRNALTDARLKQGDRRLDQADEINEARIDNLGANTSLAKSRAESIGDGPKITPTQRARNYEIDAARKKISGMDAATIRRKTQRFTNTGRENPEYDEQLAARVKRATQRKVGEDDSFDGQNGIGATDATTPTATPAADGGAITDRFIIDPTMRGMKLGRETQQGNEVLDANGKLIGYYR